MIDGISGQFAAAVPFMTGQYKDALSKERPVFSVVTPSSAPAPASVTARAAETVQEPAAPAQSQKNAASTDLRQFIASQPAAAAPVAPSAVETPFTPTFRDATGSDGLQTWNLNSTYFATHETAQWIATKYGTGEVVEVPFGGRGGLFSASASEYHVKMKDGSLINAGVLAGYYQRNPPDKFPGLADKLIRNQLGLA
jgi:hypothetical protein